MIPRHDIETRIGDVLRSFLVFKDHRRALVDRLEKEYPGYRAILMPSGRACLYYLLKALPPGKVYIPAHTCRVVPEAALLAGRKVVYVDILPEDYTMDPADLKKKLQPGGIIIATHQFGFACDLKAILAVARRKRSIVIEDFAAALGTKVYGRPAGTFSLAGFSSFEHTKIVTAGRGGFLLCRDEATRSSIRKVLEREPLLPPGWPVLLQVFRLILYKLVAVPFLYPLFIRAYIRRYGLTSDDGVLKPDKDDLYLRAFSNQQAFLALRNLSRLDRILRRRVSIAERYRSGLLGTPGLFLPSARKQSVPALIRFPIRVSGIRRDTFHSACLDRGLDLGLSGSYSCSKSCPRAVEAASQTLNLPFNSSLSDRQVDRVIAIVKAVLQEDR